MMVTVKANPIVAETKGDRVVCEGQTITLTNDSVGGVWSTASSGRLLLSDNDSGDRTVGRPASVKVTGKKLGTTYVTYAVRDRACQTNATFQVKVISNVPPTIIIGFEK
jgi:hypothetical protein